ncbi:MAG: hypothetical protein KBA97_07340 [Methanothrix sp.]|nr:hypothetical protein [Methanothrix sp.]
MLIPEQSRRRQDQAQQPTITISIKESGAPPNRTYIFHIFLTAISSSPTRASPHRTQKLRQISRRYSSLFEQSCRPELDAGARPPWEPGSLPSSCPPPGRRSAPPCPRAAPAS